MRNLVDCAYCGQSVMECNTEKCSVCDARCAAKCMPAHMLTHNAISVADEAATLQVKYGTFVDPYQAYAHITRAYKSMEAAVFDKAPDKQHQIDRFKHLAAVCIRAMESVK